WSADERTRTLSVAAALGEGAASLPLVTLPYGVGAVGWIAANRAPLEISDVFRDARFVGHDWRKSHGLASFSGAPTVVDGRLLGGETVAAYVIDRQRAEVSPVAGYHIPEAVREGLREARLPLVDARFSDALLEQGQVVWSDDAPNDARFANSFFARFPHRSCAFIPLLGGAQVSGVLHLVWWTQPRRLSVGEIALLQAIGTQ